MVGLCYATMDKNASKRYIIYLYLYFYFIYLFIYLLKFNQTDDQSTELNTYTSIKKEISE